MPDERLPDNKSTNPQYVRNWPCAVCKEIVTARRIINGWIIKCECGEVHRSGFETPNNKLWTRRDG